MIPFSLLTVLFVVLWVLGHFGVPTPFGWWAALRFALAGMFLLTASAHWGRRRPDLVRMVPPSFPRPEFLVTITGVLEILGAIGLIWAPTAPHAALGLFLLLIALFPANVHAARTEASIGGRKVTSLLPRTILQLLFLTATATVFWGKNSSL